MNFLLDLIFAVLTDTLVAFFSAILAAVLGSPG